MGCREHRLGPALGWGGPGWIGGAEAMWGLEMQHLCHAQAPSPPAPHLSPLLLYLPPTNAGRVRGWGT